MSKSSQGVIVHDCRRCWMYGVCTDPCERLMKAMGLATTPKPSVRGDWRKRLADADYMIDHWRQMTRLQGLAVLLRYKCGLGSRDIGDLLGRSKNAVEHLLARAAQIARHLARAERDAKSIDAIRFPIK